MMKSIFCFVFLFYFAGAQAEKKSDGVILIPPGEHLVHRPIVLTTGMSLIGEDATSTLKLADGANCSVIIVGSLEMNPTEETEDVYIGNIKINGNRKNQQWEGWGGEPELQNQGSDGKNFIRNNGISIRHAKNVTIKNVEVIGARSGGIVIEKKSKAIVIHSVKLNDSEFDGLAIYESWGVYVVDADLMYNQYAGISLDLQANHNYFMGIRAKYNGHQGIFARNCVGNIFYKMAIRGNGKHGIFLAESELGPAVENAFMTISFLENHFDYVVNDKSCVGNTMADIIYVDKILCGVEK